MISSRIWITNIQRDVHHHEAHTNVRHAFRVRENRSVSCTDSMFHQFSCVVVLHTYLISLVDFLIRCIEHRCRTREEEDAADEVRRDHQSGIERRTVVDTIKERGHRAPNEHHTAQEIRDGDNVLLAPQSPHPEMRMLQRLPNTRRRIIFIILFRRRCGRLRRLRPMRSGVPPRIRVPTERLEHLELVHNFSPLFSYFTPLTPEFRMLLRPIHTHTQRLTLEFDFLEKRSVPF